MIKVDVGKFCPLFMSSTPWLVAGRGMRGWGECSKPRWKRSRGRRRRRRRLNKKWLRSMRKTIRCVAHSVTDSGYSLQNDSTCFEPEFLPLLAAFGRREGQEEGGHETSRWAWAEEEVGGGGQKEEDSTSGEMMLNLFLQYNQLSKKNPGFCFIGLVWTQVYLKGYLEHDSDKNEVQERCERSPVQTKRFDRMDRD